VAVVRLARPARSDATANPAVDQDERAWVAAAQRDPQAFAPLYHRYAQPIYRFCYRKVGDVDLANDLTAQVFVKAIEKIDRYQPSPGATFRSWLFTIARNTVTDAWRRHKPTVDVDALIEVLVDDEPSPERHALEAEDRMRVDHLLTHLPESQRAIVELRLAGLTTKELMATLSMSESAIKSAQHRAYRRLRELVQATEGAGS
jgi:RNA polymerase sigma-70 factor (ECF subfamily)